MTQRSVPLALAGRTKDIVSVHYQCGTDSQGNLRVVRVPDNMTEEEVIDLVEEALGPPYSTVYPITITELKRIIKGA